MWGVRLPALLLAVVSCLAPSCSPHDPAPGTDAATSCPNDLPTACPSKIPSYKDDVAFVFELHCNTCHGEGGSAEGRPLVTYDDVYRQRGSVLNQIYNCHMPPETERPLTAEQRADVLAWLVCKAPNN
jgi:hypothetical protein